MAQGLVVQGKKSQGSGDTLASYLFNVCPSFPNDVLVKLLEDWNRD